MAESGDETDEMHRQVGWMQAGDVAILEFLHAARDKRGNPAIQTPRTIRLNTGYSRQHASTRCGVLADYGLVERVDIGEGEGKYRLSDFGERVMRNEVDLEELDALDPDDEE